MTAGRDAVRLFIALDLPPAAKGSLGATAAQLKAVIPSGVRWVDPAGVHLTLKFLGDTDTGLVEPILAAMQPGAGAAGAASFPLQLSGLGVLPNYRKPRSLWAGVGGDLEALGRLQRRVDEAMARLGFPPERRPFRPHLTLGRVQRSVSTTTRREIGETLATQFAILKSNRREPEHAWQAIEMHLIQSRRTPQGAIYTSLGAAPMA